MKLSYLFLAEGFEELEALTVVDMMRRAGLETRTVSIVSEKIVTGAHGIPVTADTTLDKVDFSTAQWLILPGGLPGATNLGHCAPLIKALKAHAAAGKPLAAICAAPSVLGANGILKNRTATCYPGFESFLQGSAITGHMVEVDGNIITGKGPAAAIDFASAIILHSLDKASVDEVRKGMLLD
ncbi:MAG: DJ-1/PfpI family protein [Porphyromonadaceae bacterium]|nr:DJ-1/PfpI family protein [Porphyromonadaceae bacterium]